MIRDGILATLFKLSLSAQKKWRRPSEFKLLSDVVQGINLRDGARVVGDVDKDVA